ncbi:hypothetical protein EJ110_NYTH14304 [Nymphaea thermarum]|nr:hypothetical protein EJ110_NYTH14304 [Nymphaea thermarum]
MSDTILASGDVPELMMNRSVVSSSANVEGSLTTRPTRRATTKVGLSDSTVLSGRAVALRLIFPKSSHRREDLAPRCNIMKSELRSKSTLRCNLQR